jgi:hypothetical protein
MMEKARTQLDPAIHRVPLDKLRIFEITEAELEALERGAPDSIFLNLAIAVLSTALSLSAALAISVIENLYTFVVFVVVTVIGYISGATFGLLWWISRKSIRKVSAEIRSRIPPEGVQEDGNGIPTA